MAERKVALHRKTHETDIQLALALDAGPGGTVATGHAFLDHLMQQLQRHGRMQLDVTAKGDLEIDPHHLSEDLGITLGAALDGALGERMGIERYADVTLPLDETLVQVVVDFSGRAYLAFDPAPIAGDVGGFTAYHLREFFRGFVNHARATLHVRWLATGEAHHGCEAAMKAFARALWTATRVTHDALPSTKGSL
jgi:imidazoleglycerol-phosphate dehydratase